jgi:hypothetical protein
LNHEVLDAACLHDKKLYRRLMNDMAANLRKRPQALLALPRTERHVLFQPLLGLPQFDVLAQNLLIVWLGATQKEMMAAFLDALSIRHDGNGYAEGFPESVEDGVLRTAVDGLYARFPAPAVSLYLGVMDRISGVRWPNLSGLVRAS